MKGTRTILFGIAAVTLVSLCLEPLAVAQRRRRPGGAGDQAPQQDEATTRAREAYERGRAAFTAGQFQDALTAFQEAYDAFQRAARDGKRTPILSYDSGNALYRLGRYDDAASSFRESTGDSSAVRQAGVYNLGNSLVKASETEQDREEELRRAISAYEEALLLSPEDRDAKWNLELALRKLEAEQKRQQQSEQGGEGEGGGGGDRNQPQPPDSTNDSNEPQDQNRQQPGPQDESPPDEPSPSQTALTEEQARRLLEAIQSEEGEVVNERNQGRARASSGTVIGVAFGPRVITVTCARGATRNVSSRWLSSRV